MLPGPLGVVSSECTWVCPSHTTSDVTSHVAWAAESGDLGMCLGVPLTTVVSPAIGSELVVSHAMSSERVWTHSSH